MLRLRSVIEQSAQKMQVTELSDQAQRQIAAGLNGEHKAKPEGFLSACQHEAVSDASASVNHLLFCSVTIS